MRVVKFLLVLIVVALFFVFGFGYGRWYSTRPVDGQRAEDSVLRGPDASLVQIRQTRHRTRLRHETSAGICA